jgi:GNAT superfamily N-acetyltransferase
VTPVTLLQPNSPELWAEARRLVEAYVASLDLDLSFQDFQHEIESLASLYGPPGGCFLLAEETGMFVGCGGLRRFSETACEMKRLYVAPANRRGGTGRTIAKALIKQARHLGYQTILLDTLPSMSRAQALYTSLGFKSTAAYRHNPVRGASFFQLELREPRCDFY